MSGKEIDRLEKKMDRIEERIERLEIKLERINLSEIIVKGREILDTYQRLQKIGVIDAFRINEDLLQIKQMLNNIVYHPWQWLERDPRAKQAFISVLNKRIAEEVSNAALFTLYEEQPDVVVKVVKDAVKEYLDIWEINDQVALNIVNNVMNSGYYTRLVKDVLSVVLPNVKNMLKLEYKRKLSEAKKLLEKEG